MRTEFLRVFGVYLRLACKVVSVAVMLLCNCCVSVVVGTFVVFVGKCCGVERE